MANDARSIRQHRYAFLWGFLVAAVLHAFLGAALASAARGGLRERPAASVEVDLVDRPPVPPPPPSPPPPEPLPEPPKSPKIVLHKVPSRPIARPAPNRDPPPTPTPTEEAKPVFGVTPESVVPGESDVAVAVGNTLMTQDRKVAPAVPPPLPPAPPSPPPFNPVDEQSIATWPTVKVEVKPAYPQMANRLGVGGKVLLKIGVDRHGRVKSVRVLQNAGYGMDEEAVKAMWKFSFNPARLPNGEPVDFVFTYTCTFQPQPGR